MKSLKFVHFLIGFTVLGGIVLTSCNPRKKVQKYAYHWKDDKANDTEAIKVEEIRVSEATGKATRGISGTVTSVLAEADTYMGTPYKYGGTSKQGIDCSGLTQNAWASAGISLPRSSFDQSQAGAKVKKDEVQPGDLVFFSAYKNGKIDHVGMVTEASDDGITFIHATVSKGVRVDRLDTGYWAERFMSARRVETLSSVESNTP